MNVPLEEIEKVYTSYPQYTVYGLSSNLTKASYRISRNMRDLGFDVVGVYPKENEIDGMTIYRTIADVPMPHRKMINVFRRSERVMSVVDEAIAAGGVELLWFQLGIKNIEAENKAQEHGMKVISDRCIYVDYMRKP